MTVGVAIYWGLLAALPLFVLGLTVFNLAVWPRGASDGAFEGSVSVLIPARDEAETIERAVRSVFEAETRVDEVVVCDDGSTDGTREILEELGDEFDRLRIVEGGELPAGWVGKPHACHRLERAAEGDVLVFLDADTRLASEGLARLASLLESGPGGRASMVTAVPRQRTDSWFERLVVPLLHVTYLSWLPLPLVWRTDDPRFLAANGQLMAIRREALDEVGGFEAVRDEVVDDVALARRMKQSGCRVVFADGSRMATCRMYSSPREVWEGFSKNLYEGIGESPAALVGIAGLYAAAFVLPYLALAGVPFGVPAVPALVGVGANVVARSLLVVRFEHPLEGPILHPVGVLALIAIAVNSFNWHRRGEIRWAGRTYRPKSERLESTEASGAAEEES